MILGVDPGLANVGWALLSPSRGLHSYDHIETERQDRTGDAAKRLAKVMFGLSTPLRAVPAAEPLTVIIEWPGGAGGFQRDGASPNARATIQTSTTAGAIYGAAYWLLRGHTERILTPAPVTWRAAVARAVGIQRTEAAVHAYLISIFPQLAGLTKKSAPHVLDAVGLALYGTLI